MKLNYIFFLIVFFTLVKTNLFSQSPTFINYKVDTNYSFRGLSVVDDSVAWLAGSNGVIGRTINGGAKWKFTTVNGFEKSDFRTIYAFDEKNAIIANAGSPAYIMRTADAGKHWLMVYKNNDSLAFFDGIDFWDKDNGIIYGDPIGGKMLVLTTTDGGFTWKNLPYENRPILENGEASFAASGTNINCFDENKVMIATGGKVSRIWISVNKGLNWLPMKTPILHGKPSQGIFSFALLNAKQFVIVGGDYLNETSKEKHVFYTNDSGKKWVKPKNPTGGYRECVTYLTPNILIAVGPSGADISYNGGKDWNEIANERNLHVIRKAREGKLIIVAGKKRVSVIKLNEKK